MSLENELWLVVFIVVFLLVSVFLWYCFISEQKMRKEYRLIADAEANIIRKALNVKSDKERKAILVRAFNILHLLPVDEMDVNLELIRNIRRAIENLN
jgi:hypothetical protein